MVFAHLSGQIFVDIETWPYYFVCLTRTLYIGWQKQFSLWANIPQFCDPSLRRGQKFVLSSRFISRILPHCNLCHHPWCVGDKCYHKALIIMFSCDGISDHASWNEVFHYWTPNSHGHWSADAFCSFWPVKDMGQSWHRIHGMHAARSTWVPLPLHISMTPCFYCTLCWIIKRKWCNSW